MSIYLERCRHHRWLWVDLCPSQRAAPGQKLPLARAAVGRELKLSSLKNSRDRSMSSLRRGLMQVAVIHMCLFPWSELPELILKGVKKLKNLVARDIQSALETLQSE